MKVLAFAASNESQSINRALATYAAGLIEGAMVEGLNVHDFELPIFSKDRELKLGQPDLAKAFLAKIAEADAIIISFAEHNGGYSAAYKNLFDWASRIDRKVYQNKPAVFLSTSPGPGGGARVLDLALNSAPQFGADVKGSLSVPSFDKCFDLVSNQMRDGKIEAALRQAVEQLGASSEP